MLQEALKMVPASFIMMVRPYDDLLVYLAFNTAHAYLD